MRQASAASAYSEIKSGVGRLLWEWEGSNELTPEGADKVLRFVLRHKRLNDALQELTQAPRKRISRKPTKARGN